MINGGFIKILGIVATAISLGATIVTNWVDEKKMDDKIEKKVNEVFANKNNGES